MTDLKETGRMKEWNDVAGRKIKVNMILYVGRKKD